MRDSQTIAVLEQLKANTKQLQKQGETFVHAMERIEDRIDKRFEEVNQLLTDMQSQIRDVRNEMRQLKNHEPDKKPPTRLAVTMSDRTVVKCENASNTFVEVIRKLGRRRVKDLNLKVNRKDLMSTTEDDQQRLKLGGYWIHVDSSTKRKKGLLEDIASGLDVKLEVEIIPKI